MDYMRDTLYSDSPNEVTARYIYKGPYDLQKGMTAIRLNAIYDRSLLFDQIGVQYPKMTLLNEADGENKKLWIRMMVIHPVPFDQLRVIRPQIKTFNPETDTQYTIVDVKEGGVMMGKEVVGKFCNGWMGHVIDRECTGVIRMSDATAEMIRDHPQTFRTGFMYVFLRNLFNPPIGDSASWNILINMSDWSVYSVDFEEVCNSQKEEELTVKNWPLIVQKRVLKANQENMMNKVFGLKGAKEIQTEKEVKNRLATMLQFEVFSQKMKGVEDSDNLFQWKLQEKYMQFFKNA